jgi:hypothetical protein
VFTYTFDARAMLGNIQRVLKPGGTFAFGSDDRLNSPPLRASVVHRWQRPDRSLLWRFIAQPASCWPGICEMSSGSSAGECRSMAAGEF